MVSLSVSLSEPAKRSNMQTEITQACAGTPSRTQRGIIPLNPDNPLEDGYVYVSNSKERGGDGGVYDLYFDKDGNIMAG